MGKSRALDMWRSLMAGADAALEFWRASRGKLEVVSESVRVEYRGFVEQADGTWVWEPGWGDMADQAYGRAVEFEPGKWSGEAARPMGKPHVFVAFCCLEDIVDCMRRFVYQTDDGEPPKH